MKKPSPETTRFVVTPEFSGERLDRFLAAVSSLSRRGARSLLRESGVVRNGQRLRVEGRILSFGDVVTVRRPAEELGAPPEPILEPVELIHKDIAVVAANKPSGVLSQPAETRQEGELALDERLFLQLALEEGRPPFLRTVHRLDRVTSGLLLFAASPRALAPLARAWQTGQVERKYLAVVAGRFPSGSSLVDAPIGRDARHRWRFEIASHGKEARTEVKALRSDEATSLVECRLETGRTHQVRVHLAHLGFPVLGDLLYGGPADLSARPLLHAAELHLPHPKTGHPLRLNCPPPDDFLPFLALDK